MISHEEIGFACDDCGNSEYMCYCREEVEESRIDYALCLGAINPAQVQKTEVL